MESRRAIAPHVVVDSEQSHIFKILKFSLLTHGFLLHGGEKLSEEKRVRCRLCGKTFNSAEELDTHNKDVHPTAHLLSHLVHGDTGKETK